MRAALWLLALFAVAVAVALFAGNNQGTITVFWPPYRIDLSLNLVLLVLVATFVALHVALRTLAALFEMPAQARRWRAQQRERATHAALLDAIGHLLAGRFLRSRKAALAALAREKALDAAGEHIGHAVQLRALAHLVAAENAQALQDKASRDEHLRLALAQTAGRATAAAQEIREGTQLRAARWALDERDVQASLAWLDAMPQGAQRRTLALRIKLKAARLARQTSVALETARLLAKHGAFSRIAAQSLVRGLVSEMVQGSHDAAQLQRVWSGLDGPERQIPEVAIQAAQRLMGLNGDGHTARTWLLPVWERSLEDPQTLTDTQRVKLVQALEAGLASSDAVADRDWLARIETAQQYHLRDASLQYLAGMACMKRQLWGKAQQLLTQALTGLRDPALRANAWRSLAELAEQRGDEAAAAHAWKRAALDRADRSSPAG
jgi:HemY protein